MDRPDPVYEFIHSLIKKHLDASHATAWILLDRVCKDENRLGVGFGHICHAEFEFSVRRGLQPIGSLTK